MIFRFALVIRGKVAHWNRIIKEDFFKEPKDSYSLFPYFLYTPNCSIPSLNYTPAVCKVDIYTTIQLADSVAESMTRNVSWNIEGTNRNCLF